jgi:predicted nucleic acid-binding Zn ribbon protein
MKKARSDKEGEALHIGAAIQHLLREYHIKAKFDEASVVASWERLVGKPIAKRTKKVFVRNKVVFVELESPSMKHDLQLHKAHMLEIFRKEFGAEAVADIVLM